MSHRRRWVAGSVVLLAVVPACVGEGSAPSGEPSSVTIEPIVGGVPATLYPEAAILNIDVPDAGGSWWACSATVIAPRVVLTAGHCVDGHSHWDVYCGAQHQSSTSAVTYDWHGNGETVNPSQHDLGLVFLSASITLSSYPTIATAPVAAGTKVADVGRIENGTLTSSLYMATAPVNLGTAYGYPFDYEATDLIQPGDSGGPDFLSGTHQILAVNSGAGSGIEVLARTDLLASWIAAQIAAHPATGVVDAGADAKVADASGDAKPADAAPDVKADAVSDARPTDAPSEAASDASREAASGDGAVAEAAAPEAGGSSGQEQEPNDTLPQANPIGGATMTGAVSPSTDVDWFLVTAPVGNTTLTLAAGADAVFGVGVVQGGSCPLLATGLTAAQVGVQGAAASLCLVVTSPGGIVQGYTVGVAH